MNIDRFRRLAEAFGGDLSRWPEAERKAAGALLRADPAARRIIDDELALDALLDRAATTVDDARVGRTAAAIAARLDAGIASGRATARLKAFGPKALMPDAFQFGAVRPFSGRFAVVFLAAMALAGAAGGAISGRNDAGGFIAAAVAVAGDAGLLDSSGYYSTRYIVSWAQ